jgi:hypothetical protein
MSVGHLLDHNDYPQRHSAHRNCPSPDSILTHGAIEYSSFFWQKSVSGVDTGQVLTIRAAYLLIMSVGLKRLHQRDISRRLRGQSIFGAKPRRCGQFSAGDNSLE